MLFRLMPYFMVGMLVFILGAKGFAYAGAPRTERGAAYNDNSSLPNSQADENAVQEDVGKDLAKENSDCVKCHIDQWDSALDKAFIHQPFLDKKCKYCHIRDSGSAESQLEFKEDKNVLWLATRRLNTKSHWFNIAAKDVNNLLLVDILVPGEGNRRKEIVVQDWDEIEELKDDERPPNISNVRIVNIERGLFINAIIAWETDELSSSQIKFGIKKINSQTNISKNMTTSHLMVLSGLKSKKKYKFTVSSADIFGNQSISKTYAFSTKRSKQKAKGKKATSKYPDELVVDHKFYRTEKNIMVKMAVNKPVLIAIGVPKEDDAAEEKQKSLITAGVLPENHDLRNANETNNTICEPCHGAYVKGRNHPINVSAKENMRIPAEFFVLENGNITCMTCHAAHSSNNDYRLVRSSKKDLCIACHITKVAPGSID